MEGDGEWLGEQTGFRLWNLELAAGYVFHMSPAEDSILASWLSWTAAWQSSVAHTLTQVTTGQLLVVCGPIREALVRNHSLSQTTDKSRCLPDHFLSLIIFSFMVASSYLKTFCPGAFHVEKWQFCNPKDLECKKLCPPHVSHHVTMWHFT